MSPNLQAPLAVKWEAIGPSLAAFGLVITIVIWWTQRRSARKAFGYDVTARSLVRIGAEARDAVEVRYHGEIIEDVHLVQISLRNTGNQPLRRDDFEQPVRIELPSSCEPLTSTLTVTSDPSDMGAEVGWTGPVAIEVSPALFNAGDRIDVSVLVRSVADLESVQPKVRIAGVKRPDPSTERRLAGGRISSSVLFPATLIGFFVVISALAALGIVGPDRDRVVLNDGREYCAEVTRVRNEVYLQVPFEDAEKTVIVPDRAIRRIDPSGC